MIRLSRRQLLRLSGAAAFGVLTGDAGARPLEEGRRAAVMAESGGEERAVQPGLVTLFLCGDVMTGRGIDQVLPHPGDPRLYESSVESAATYVELAERANGAIPRPVSFSYVWGDALDELARVAPDVHIVNLETSVTTSEEWLPKGVNYRMNPENVPCLTAARIDCCALANNHVLDFGRAGLVETLETLRMAKLGTAGAGLDASEAQAPAILDVGGKGRVIVFSFGTEASGIPPDWAATARGPGVDLLPDLSKGTVRSIDVVSRFGGDEFTVVLPQTGVQGAATIAERIRSQLQKEVFLEDLGLEVRITASFGVATFPDHGSDKDDLIAQADRAMYSVKGNRKNAVAVAA